MDSPPPHPSPFFPSPFSAASFPSLCSHDLPPPPPPSRFLLCAFFFSSFRLFSHLSSDVTAIVSSGLYTCTRRDPGSADPSRLADPRAGSPSVSLFPSLHESQPWCGKCNLPDLQLLTWSLYLQKINHQKHECRIFFNAYDCFSWFLDRCLTPTLECVRATHLTESSRSIQLSFPRNSSYFLNSCFIGFPRVRLSNQNRNKSVENNTVSLGKPVPWGRQWRPVGWPASRAFSRPCAVLSMFQKENGRQVLCASVQVQADSEMYMELLGNMPKISLLWNGQRDGAPP